MRTKLKPEVLKFLRKEAIKMFKGLPDELRSGTNERQIYRELKACWRAGQKLDAAGRDKAMSLTYKQTQGLNVQGVVNGT